MQTININFFALIFQFITTHTFTFSTAFVPAGRKSINRNYYACFRQSRIRNPYHRLYFTTSNEHTKVNSSLPVNYIPPKLSIILPAYNEQDRIGPTLIEYVTYLSSPNTNFLSHPTEIIVVDDGSTDQTCAVVHKIASNLNKAIVDADNTINNKITIKCISLPNNMGKGAAITEGCLHVLQSTSLVLVADADGSGNIQSLQSMIMTLFQNIVGATLSSSSSFSLSPSLDQSKIIWDSKPAILVGIRKNKDETSSPILRSILRWGFRTAVKLICFPNDLGVKDTQCGFKLMSANAAKLLYPKLHLTRWTHDVELLYIAKQLNSVIICETKIDWVDKAGSKIVQTPGGTVFVSCQMLLDVIIMRYKYLSGDWTV